MALTAALLVLSVVADASPPHAPISDQIAKPLAGTKQWVPVHIDPVPTVSKNFSTGRVTPPTPTVVWPNGIAPPATFGDLNDEVDTNMYELTMDEAAKLNVPTLQLGASQSLARRVL